MYGLEYGKGHVSCGFCGKTGHNITSCNRVAEVYQNAEYEFKTHYSDGEPIDSSEVRPWILFENWWELSRMEQKAAIEMTNREKRQANRERQKLKKRQQRCSFCRKEGHRRPSCKHHKKFTKTMYKANAVWRRQFVDLINITGMGIGALVEIPKSTMSWWMGEGERVLCLITGYSLESLNVFSSYKKRDEFRTIPQMFLMDTTTGDEIKVGFDRIKPFVDSGLSVSKWSTSFIKVISPVEWHPKEEWLDATDSEEVDYVLKKLSVTSDNFPFVNGFINIWNKGANNE